ncbi:MAG TPA: hypothetical protein VGU03_11045 [Frateuria sp.]|uniref:hypothetical protein n=1 Tax=Frateuria sp. TaxID=2211372 RepID=UPI002DED9E99|nr:hypothetical protein [Frateuria sp.]
MVDEEGFWRELEDVGNAYVEWRTRHGDEYAIEIKSDRFHPEIRRGALVIFSPRKELAFNEYALVQLRDGRSTILEFLRQDGNLYTFTALQSGGRRVSLETSQIEHVHAYAGTAPASDKQHA